MNRRELLELAAMAGAAAIVPAAASAEPATAAAPARTRIQMLVYPGMTLQDLVGPLQVWAAWPGVEIQFAWKTPGPVSTDSGLAVVATTSLATFCASIFLARAAPRVSMSVNFQTRTAGGPL